MGTLEQDIRSTLDAKLADMRARAERCLANRPSSPPFVNPHELLVLVECTERLQLVVAADEKAIRELREMFGVTVDTQAESFELMDGNKAALAKLGAL
jgi:hypothetical protein